MGAEVHGFALPPATDPSFYEVCRLEALLASNTLADIATPGTVLAALKATQPEVVLHLAAQAFVRQSYQDAVAYVPANNFSAGMQAKWNVLDFGRRSAQMDQRSATLRLAEEDLARVRDQVALEVEKAYRNAICITRGEPWIGAIKFAQFFGGVKLRRLGSRATPKPRRLVSTFSKGWKLATLKTSQRSWS